MRPQVLAVTATGVSQPLPVNWRERTFALGIAVNVGGGGTYTVQYSYDDPEGVYATDYSTNALWNDDASLAGATASGTTSQTAPVRAIRLSVAAVTDTITLTVLQAT